MTALLAVEEAASEVPGPAAPLPWRSWLPRGGAPAHRPALLFVHGLADHSRRYAWPGAWMAARGYPAFAFDYRGHGRAAGPRIHVDSFAEYDADLDAAVAALQEREPARPLVVVGHSQGGLLALSRALRQPQGIAGLVVSSPFLAPHPDRAPNAMLRLGVKLLLRAAPALRVPLGVPSALVSRDPEVARRYGADPLVGRAVSAAWFRAVLAAQRAVGADAGRLRTPTLLMAAGDDRLVDTATTRAWASAAPAGVVEWVEWPGLYHELFNEPEREAVYARVEAWLSARFGATSAASATA